ncbi:hypothetical protein [Ruegeria sp. HKCCD7318]|uniref:hypothetical protein n=1 Tax=Ruegeria sp. HKCCD7318 TaxID=2683014 RepID=UPI00149204F5|nr:hypothetical protein [Ruegeria sp. HKCCD7318]NOE32505.1 hypothetical protein [Ruegeria sp. HKCCD7318]
MQNPFRSEPAPRAATTKGPTTKQISEVMGQLIVKHTREINQRLDALEARVEGIGDQTAKHIEASASAFLED